MQAEFTNSSSGGRIGRNVGRDFLNSDGSNSEYTLRWDNHIYHRLLLMMNGDIKQGNAISLLADMTVLLLSYDTA